MINLKVLVAGYFIVVFFVIASIVFVANSCMNYVSRVGLKTVVTRVWEGDKNEIYNVQK